MATDVEELRIYSDDQGARTTYIFDLIFKDLLGIDYAFCTALQAHLSYSDNATNGLVITPHGLLSETNIRENISEEIKFESFGNSKCFFRTSNSGFAFDLFSASFYLVSRYEEYLEFYEDEHRRFTARESILFQENLLEEPLVNQWALILKDALKEMFPELKFQPQKFQYISTLDIDQAWKFKHKGLKRNIAGFFRDIFHLNLNNVLSRWPIVLRLKRDPFFTFGWLNERHHEYSTRTKYFMLVGDRGPYDKNIDWRKRAFQKLIVQLDALDNSELGIHPSYASSIDIDLEYKKSKGRIKDEIKRLSEITDREIYLSRQHFLLHRFPETYQALIKSDIHEDHTMGYSTMAGFRAGIAAPFYYFDLKENVATQLKLVPFCLMDITPLYYMELNLKQAIEHMEQLMDKVHSVGGVFVSLWHNESLSNDERWKGWRPLYEAMLRKASELT